MAARFLIGRTKVRDTQVCGVLTQNLEKVRNARHPAKILLAVINRLYQLSLTEAAKTQGPLALGDSELILSFKSALKLVPVDTHKARKQRINERFGLIRDGASSRLRLDSGHSVD